LPKEFCEDARWRMVSVSSPNNFHLIDDGADSFALAPIGEGRVCNWKQKIDRSLLAIRKARVVTVPKISKSQRGRPRGGRGVADGQRAARASEAMAIQRNDARRNLRRMAASRIGFGDRAPSYHARRFGRKGK
jgi:hypothetical protein